MCSRDGRGSVVRPCALFGAALWLLSCAGAPEPPPRVEPAPRPVAIIREPAPGPEIGPDVISGERVVKRAEAWSKDPRGAGVAAREAWSKASHSGRSHDRLVVAFADPVDLETAVDASLALEIATAYAARLGDAAPYGLELRTLSESIPGKPGIARFAVVLRAAGRDGLRVSRDLSAHPRYRELFWQAARRLGRESVFAPDAVFEDTTGVARITELGGHQTLRIAPVRDASQIGGCCRAESATAVGEVTLEGLIAVGAQLEQTDAYATRPVPPVPWSFRVAPDSGDAPEIAGEVGSEALELPADEGGSRSDGTGATNSVDVPDVETEKATTAAEAAGSQPQGAVGAGGRE